MTIQDINYLKKNSTEALKKIHFTINNSSGSISLKNIQNGEILNSITNVFAVNIIQCHYNTSSSFTPFALSFNTNDIKLDSIFITNNNPINILTRDFENKIHPISSLSEISYKVIDAPSFNGDLYVSLSIHYYSPSASYNDKYNDLNPQYDPHVLTWGYSTEDDEEY